MRPGFQPGFHDALASHPVFCQHIVLAPPVILPMSAPPLVVDAPEVVPPVIVQPLLFAGVDAVLWAKALLRIGAIGYSLLTPFVATSTTPTCGMITHHAFFGGFTATFEVLPEGVKISVADNHRDKLQQDVYQAIVFARAQ